jgi:hypothetical protein
MPAVWTAAIVILAIAAIAASSHVRPRSVKRASVPQVPASTAQRGRVRANLDALPLAFEANQGQTDPQVKYIARGNGYKLFLTSSKAIMNLPSSKKQSEVLDMMMNKRRGAAGVTAMLKKRAGAHHQVKPAASLEMNFLGGNPNPQLIAEDLQSGKINYFIGNDPSKWHSNISLYGRVKYRNVYPGVDLAFHGASKQLEFDYLVAPGADPKSIALSFNGADSLRTNASGDLILATAAGPVELHKPVAYQLKNGQQESVNAEFVLKANNEVAFQLGAYDHGRELVIDPTVTYATYFGGGGADYGNGIAVDGSGNAFVAGSTDSATIPGNPGAALGTDAFVTEIDPSGALVFTIIFGGSADDFPGGMAIDSTGIYVAGTTDSNDFPTTGGSAQPTFIGGSTTGNNDAFAIKFNLSGTTTVWGTYIAGSDSDSGLGVAVDNVTHAVYVAGETYSNNLGGATGGVNPLPNGNAVNRSGGAGVGDGYIAALTADGTGFTLISYIGGSAADLATGVAVNQQNGDIFVTGETISTNLPTTAGVVQPKCGTDQNCNAGTAGALDDAFVVSIALTSTNPPYAYNYVTYYGGSDADYALGIAADASGNAFITGSTSSTDLLLSSATPYQSSLFGTANAFIAELNNVGTAVAYDTYFGGDGSDFGLGIALDNLGSPHTNVYVTGQSTSSSASFPLVNPTQGDGSGNSDAFVSVLSVDKGQVLFSTLLGGGGDEDQFQAAIAVDPITRDIYVTGDTDSGNGSTAAFPTQAPITGGDTYGGGTCTSSVGNSVPCTDAFVAGYTTATAPDFSITATALSPASVPPGGSATSTITVSALNGYSGTVNLSCSVSGSGSPLPACNIDPSGTTLAVTTSGAAAAVHSSSGMYYAMFLPVVGLSLVGISFSGADSRRKKVTGFLLVGLMMGALFLLPACGGGGGGGGGGGCAGCTPPGSYEVTVTGTDSGNANLTHDIAVPLTLTVQ